jgi:hypothetical protein
MCTLTMYDGRTPSDGKSSHEPLARWAKNNFERMLGEILISSQQNIQILVIKLTPNMQHPYYKTI